MKKVLCIHGIGGKDASIEVWSKKWAEAIANASGVPISELSFEFLMIDKIFEKYQKRDGIHYLRAVATLLKDWISVSLSREAKGLGIKDAITWSAGMVVQFTDNADLRAELNQLLKQVLDSPNRPDIIFAHSLGTLLTYDLLRQEAVKGKSRDLTLVTAASQVGHPALLKFFGGTIMPLNIRHWFNFHNQNDHVFAYESIEVAAPNYTEIQTPFDEPGSIINHDALMYINHQNAILQGWPQVMKIASVSAQVAKGLTVNEVYNVEKIKPVSSRKKKNTYKALLVGINDYPDPENQLNGCVNDVFRVSEVLQEMGFDPADIRVVLNERATSKNIRTMMDWLLKDAKDGDTRFFFYSGHGAQIPASGIDGDADHLDECLVTYDFDWTRENAYTDKEFLKSYSQLSYGINFVTILDCCHSGGMTRDGVFKARGINPPDDIRHRTIKWDPRREMWIPREMQLSKRNLFSHKSLKSELFTGEGGGTQRFGRAISLWSDVKTFNETKAKYGTKGPFMPLIIEACKETEYSYEYKHGVTSFGAFTYSFTTILRELNRKKRNKKLTYKQLLEYTALQLKQLGYSQSPQIVGPDVKVNSVVPFLDLGY